MFGKIKTITHVIQSKRSGVWVDIAMASDTPTLAINEVIKLREGLQNVVRLVRRETIKQDIEMA